MTVAVGGAAEGSASWRFKLGIAIFALIPLGLLFIPLAVALDAPAGTVAALTGVIVIGNKVLLLLVIAGTGRRPDGHPNSPLRRSGVLKAGAQTSSRRQQSFLKSSGTMSMTSE